MLTTLSMTLMVWSDQVVIISITQTSSDDRMNISAVTQICSVVFSAMHRLPIDSARKLRWYDKGDVATMVKTHVREKHELLDTIAALKKVSPASWGSLDVMGLTMGPAVLLNKTVHCYTSMSPLVSTSIHPCTLQKDSSELDVQGDVQLALVPLRQVSCKGYQSLTLVAQLQQPGQCLTHELNSQFPAALGFCDSGWASVRI